MGDPRPSYAALMPLLARPRLTAPCRVCGARVQRRWWQVLLGDVALCPRGELGLCHARGVAREGGVL